MNTEVTAEELPVSNLSFSQQAPRHAFSIAISSVGASTSTMKYCVKESPTRHFGNFLFTNHIPIALCYTDISLRNARTGPIGVGCCTEELDRIVLIGRI